MHRNENCLVGHDYCLWILTSCAHFALSVNSFQFPLYEQKCVVLSSFLNCYNSLPVPPLINELNIILDTCSFHVCVRIMATFSFSSECESPSVVSDSLWPHGLYSLIPGSRRSPGEGNGFPHFSGKEIPTPVFLPGEFHGQRSLVGYSPWGYKELDMTEAT